MAKPRVLVSSTCYDLYLIREQLRNLIDDMGYEAVLSEDGDIYFNPDLHVHLSCISEIRHCDMVVLVVGNKFGSEYVLNSKKSITQTEHDTAYISTIPIFSFIDQKVLHDYSIYRKVIEQSKDKTNEEIKNLINSIPFNSQPDIRVFSFIDDICSKQKNNAYFPFQNFKDIRDTLKKQWAGMVFDFLNQKRTTQADNKIINLLSQVEIASDKIENIVELIAKNTLTGEAKDSLQLIDNTATNKRLNAILYEIWDSFKFNKENINRAKNITTEEINKIIEVLNEIPESEEKHSTAKLQKILQEIGLLEKNSYYMHYKSKYRIGEFVETCERSKLKEKDVSEAIKYTLEKHFNQL